jgi:hypothetical protein
MRIDRDGRWHYRGSPIGRQQMVRLFASILHRLPDGSYWLVTPAEQGMVEVEDVPFVAVELRADGIGREQRLEFRTNTEDWVAAGPDHKLVVRPTADGSEAPYLTVRDGLEARLLRPVFYHLVELAEPDPSGDRLGVWSAGVFFPIGSTEA